MQLSSVSINQKRFEHYLEISLFQRPRKQIKACFADPLIAPNITHSSHYFCILLCLQQKVRPSFFRDLLPNIVCHFFASCNLWLAELCCKGDFSSMLLTMEVFLRNENKQKHFPFDIFTSKLLKPSLVQFKTKTRLVMVKLAKKLLFFDIGFMRL